MKDSIPSGVGVAKLSVAGRRHARHSKRPMLAKYKISRVPTARSHDKPIMYAYAELICGQGKEDVSIFLFKRCKHQASDHSCPEVQHNA